MYGVDLVGVELVKNNPTATGGLGGAKPPWPMASKFGELAGQVWGKMSTIQSTIDCGSTGQPTRQTRKPLTKNQIYPQIDQNAKKHKNRQNDVIFTGSAVQKISCSKISSFDF